MALANKSVKQRCTNELRKGRRKRRTVWNVMHPIIPVRTVKSGRRRRGKRVVVFGERDFSGSDMSAEGDRY